VVALAEAGTPLVGLWNRTPERALALAQDLLPVLEVSSAATRVTVLRGADPIGWDASPTLLVNATSVGLDGLSVPLSPEQLPAEVRLYDLVYGLEGTPLVRRSLAVGHRAVDGLWMLVYQASAAFTLWTGQDPPEQIMYAAALAALQARRDATVAVGKEHA
jgi:shikimate 5-dehydrogenase